MLLVLWCVRAAPLAQESKQQPVFRTSADVITVPVFVRVSGTPVGGLKPDDFVVLDNGVPQTVESLDGEAVPADITILVETSKAMKNYLGTINGQVQKISAMVRPTDRLEILGIDTYVEELLPLKPAAEQPALGRLTVGGYASVNDALVAALLREPDRERPHLIIAITDTVDSMSVTDMATVRDVAKQSGATLVIAWVTMSQPSASPSWYTSEEREDAFIAALGTRSEARTRAWIPHHTPRAGRPLEAFDALKEAAETTGGALHPPGVFIDRSAAAIFGKIFNEYRHSYILRYTAQGVARDGWHEISVTTPKFPSYELRARRGYLVETPKPPVDRATLPPGSLLALVSAEDADDSDGVRNAIRDNSDWRSLVKLIDGFKSGGGNAFPDAPRREFTLALDLAESALPSPVVAVRADGFDLLTRYARLVRQVSGTDTFEHEWVDASVALAEATLRPSEAQKFLDEMAKRFPSEPRVVLARAVLADQVTTHMANLTPAYKGLADLLANYDAAIAMPSVAAEARLRKARLLHRLARDLDALALLDTIGPTSDDPTLTYWRALLRGQVLDGLGRTGEAIGAYRAALDLVPESQSARVGLMTSLARTGARVEAQQVAETILSSTSDTDDSWWYWQADYRFYRQMHAWMKEMAK